MVSAPIADSPDMISEGVLGGDRRGKGSSIGENMHCVAPYGDGQLIQK